MKTIFYFLFINTICLTLGFSIQKTSKNVILHSTDSKVSIELLTQSAKIISNRLKTFDLETTVSVISDKSQIKVQIPDDINVAEIEGLLTAKGDLGFYETITVKEIADLSKKEFNTRPSEAILGCSSFENRQVVDSVENILRSVNLLSDYKIVWGLKNSKSLTCLYAVRINPALTKTDIETIKSSKDSNSQSITVEIKFKPTSAKIWANTTKQNLDKPIAIVFDNRVFYTPVVKTTMESGMCEITGNFNQKEINYFLALVNNETLPVNLTLQ
jgi:preprotein translocase subunit SecD